MYMYIHIHIYIYTELYLCIICAPANGDDDADVDSARDSVVITRPAKSPDRITTTTFYKSSPTPYTCIPKPCKIVGYDPLIRG